MSYAPGQYPGADPGAYPGPPVPAPQQARIRPGRVWYLVALAVLLGGAAWLVVGFVSLDNEVNSFQRVALPTAHGVVSLSHAGSYVVYYEAPGVASGRLPSFNVRVVPFSAGASVRSLAPYATTVTYTIGSRQGRAALTLDVARAGRYLVIAPGAPAVTGGSDLAFGSSIAGGIVAPVVGSALLMLIGLAGLIVIFVVRRVRISRQRASYPAPGYPQPGSPQPGSPQPSYQQPGYQPPGSAG
jgi:hypothetical protein